ncbi:Hypothetical protein PHPALM_19029 [Phytophthora palmivora]|uniref:Uncharacterized protein n=1 Tax=Phytophthora palmivora TaxID=4796 RepID=A0A2P4XIB1_9STRA|nr:Hypothetical protein PHPALM_19029 [Phytophthora palmivora]
MDASDTGLCALHPARREYIRLKFDEEERTRIRQGGFSINIREQLGAVLATLCWGREWCRRATSEMTHVRCWIDNRSAVAWCNNLNCREPSAQELNRVLGAIEAQWALYISIPNAIRKIYSARWSAFSSAPSLNHLDVSTREPGSNGQSFVSASECQGGSRNTTWTRNPYCWLSSPFIAGPEEINTVEPLQVPFSLKSAISTGIIGHLPDLNLDSVQIMPSLSPECVEQVQQQGDEVPPREQCCSELSATSTSNNPSTALSQGLHYWASFFYSEALNNSGKKTEGAYTLCKFVT